MTSSLKIASPVLIHCTAETHGPAIQEIFNEAILNTTASYDDQPRSLESIHQWFASKHQADCPVIAAIDPNSQTLMAFGAYGPFRPQSGYRLTVEHSIYVHIDHRGKGLGALILQRLIELAQTQNLHRMIGAIDMANAASIGLHEKLGFQHAGTLSQAGTKFGRWLDVGFYELALSAPAAV